MQAGTVSGGVHISGTAPGEDPIPRQLPMAVAGFVNREAQLAYLDGLLGLAQEDLTSGQSSSVVVSAIGGAPGIGKTALALHWAHRARSHYADGDLYVHMRGHGPGSAVTAEQALDAILRALQVPPERIPRDLDGKAALYRSRLDRKHMLILIDDAATAEQVRPLLPASSRCLVLVTSRSTLPGLVAREGARRMTLDTLSTAEALALLRSAAGPERIDTEPASALALVTHCAHLPLALRILAERLTSQPQVPLAEFAAELAAEGERLDALGTEDDDLSDVRAVFATSYRALDAESARVFRRLSLHPGAEFSAPACAALLDLTAAGTRRALDRLTRLHLLQQIRSGRYRLHDLLRLYSAERCAAEEPREAQTRMLRQVTGWYLRTVDNAWRVVFPNFHTLEVPEDAEPEAPVVFTSREAASAWFEQERANLLAALRAASEHEQFDLAWRLPDRMRIFFELHSHWPQWREIHLSGLAAARAIGDAYGQACNYLGLADATWLLGHIEEALEHYHSALQANQAVGDGWIEGFALRHIGLLQWRASRQRDALELVERAIGVFRRTGERRGEGMSLLSLAECRASLGEVEPALEHCHTAAAIFTEIADTWSIAWAQCSLASVLAAAQRLDQALDEYRAAIAVFRDFADRDSEAVALAGMGECHAALGQPGQARDAFSAARDIHREADDPRAAEMEDKIAAL